MKRKRRWDGNVDTAETSMGADTQVRPYGEKSTIITLLGRTHVSALIIFHPTGDS